MSQFDKTDRSAYITLGILFGAAAGVIAGVLTAPRSGSETREQLRAKAQETKGRAKDQLATQKKIATEKIDHTIEKSKQVVGRAADSTRDTIDKVADKAKQATDKAKTAAQDTPKLGA